MPVALSIPSERVPATDMSHKQWTREECQALQDSGLVERERYELIEGELVRKVSKSSRHIRTLSLLIRFLTRVFEDTVLQEPSILAAPADTPTSLPEPEAVVLSLVVDTLAELPQPAQIRLIAEVSDSSLRFDLTTKAALYARAAIPDYWVIDLNARRIIVHRDPRDGAYHSIAAYAESEQVAPLASPDQSVLVGDLR